MLSWVSVAVTVLASPAGSSSLSSDVLSPSLVRHVPERSAAARLEDWFAQLAIVRPGPGGPGTGSMVLFIAVAPVSRHSMGLQAIGSF